MPEYRITFVIERFDPPSDDDFVEVGFGSSSGWGDIDAALYDVQSIISNRLWETEPGQPDPDEFEGTSGGGR